MSEDKPPALKARYVKRDAPDAGRIVTVTRVWTADDGHTAVAYDWTDDKPGWCGSACPLDVFHRTYRPEGESAAERIKGWPEPLQATFWAAVNAPTYAESRDKTLALLDAWTRGLAGVFRKEAGVYAPLRSERMQGIADGLRKAADLAGLGGADG